MSTFVVESKLDHCQCLLRLILSVYNPRNMHTLWSQFKKKLRVWVVICVIDLELWRELWITTTGHYYTLGHKIDPSLGNH